MENKKEWYVLPEGRQAVSLLHHFRPSLQLLLDNTGLFTVNPPFNPESDRYEIPRGPSRDLAFRQTLLKAGWQREAIVMSSEAMSIYKHWWSLPFGLRATELLVDEPIKEKHVPGFTVFLARGGETKRHHVEPPYICGSREALVPRQPETLALLLLRYRRYSYKMMHSIITILYNI
jgi:hypothetical protein